MQRRYKAGSVSGLLVALLLLVGQHYGWFNDLGRSAEVNQPGLYKVVEFADGDTISVDMNGSKEIIRFIGVDTPETHDPRKAVQCFGEAASNFTKHLIGNNVVRLEADSQNTNRDRYNRLLRYVYLPDNRLVNSEIIKQGYGFAYTGFPFEKLEEFRALEKQAREQNLGLWKECTPQPNQYGGYDSNDAQ